MASLKTESPEETGKSKSGLTPEKIIKSDSEWRAQLTPEQYIVTRRRGTEPPGTGAYAYSHEDGIYHCVCCGNDLFSSETKFDSGCGWPSFWAPLADEKIEARQDMSHGMIRSEVICPKCDAHLGHVFDDGPDPTGLRYCINSASLKLQKKE